MADERWPIEHVAAIAPSPRTLTAAEGLATTTTWSGLGADDAALWGRCQGSSREPYQTMVDHRRDPADGSGTGARTRSAWRCTCPSRQHPCKHALALLLMWVRGDVPVAPRPPAVAEWIEARDARARANEPTPAPGTEPTDRAPQAGGEGGDAGRGADSDADRSGGPDGGAAGTGGGDGVGGERDGESGDDRDQPRDTARDERVARMRAGLMELDRWLADRLRAGLADSSVADYDTWENLAARLVDAQVGALANRVRRVAGLVGASPDWHDRVLTEIGILHLLAQAGLRVPELPSELADSVALAVGWQVKQAVVLEQAPTTDVWFVAGRSDQREDRIEVRRVWLRSTSTGEWAMVLSFAAYGQTLDPSLRPGMLIDADLYRYPGYGLRALVGRVEYQVTDGARVDRAGAVGAVTIAEACDEIGAAVAREPWLERYAATVIATPTIVDRRWVLTDHTGSLAISALGRSVATLVAAADRPVAMTVEWSPDGVQPLTIHLDDRTIDVGRQAEASFVTEVVQ